MMYIKKQKQIYLFLCIFMVALCSFGCKSKKSTMSGGDLDYYIPTTAPKETETESVRYDKKDCGIVLDVDKDNKKITIKSILDEKVFALSYTGGTSILSRSGKEMTIDYLEKGQITDIYYSENNQKLITIQISKDAWENSFARGILVDEESGIIKYAGEKYSYDSGLVVVSDNNYIGLDEIISCDELTIRGTDKKIESIVVNNGHGFIKLTDTNDFIGGVVEIGSRITKVIEKDMVIAVPEGTYTFSVSNNGIGGTSEITIGRNDTIPVSLISYKNKIERFGLVRFNIAQKDATLIIDGKETDYSAEVELQYGTHTLKLSADGYTTYSNSFTVDNSYTTITLDLSGGKENEETSSDNNTSETETVVDSEHKIYLSTSTPDVSIYFDGLYKGTAPVSFEKITGTHIVILMKSGYVTKVYSVDIPDDDKDYVKIFDKLEAGE